RRGHFFSSQNSLRTAGMSFVSRPWQIRYPGNICTRVSRNAASELALNMLFGKRQRIIRRIMVVEDEPLVAFENEYSLSEAGYDVVATVDSFAEASRFLQQEEVHLILTDVSLRGRGDGIDVARLAAQRSVPVLFVSANCPPEAQQLAIGCLSKPYSE